MAEIPDLTTANFESGRRTFPLLVRHSPRRLAPRPGAVTHGSERGRGGDVYGEDRGLLGTRR